MPRKTPLTAAQVKRQLRARGQTITQWSRDHGYSRRDVYDVLNGVSKGNFGRAHEIAVALGMKVPEEEPSTPSATRNLQQRAAA